MPLWFWRLLGIKRYRVCYRLTSMGGTQVFRHAEHMSKNAASFVSAGMAIRYPKDQYWYEEYQDDVK